MNKIFTMLLTLVLVFSLAACVESEADQTETGLSNEMIETGEEIVESVQPAQSLYSEEDTIQIKITVDDIELFAALENNATTQALIEQMPMTLSMSDLYGREMCYRYGAYALPTDGLRTDGYEIGDIAYWPPGGSLVILYEQNEEQFERQHLGHINEGVEVFATTGDVDVKFEVATKHY